MGQLRTRKRGSTREWSFEGARINGKRNSISKGGYRTKAEALAAGTQAKAEYDNAGQLFNLSEISVSDYLDYWFDSYCKLNLRYNTQMGYLNIIEKHLKPALGHYQLKSLTPSSIQSFVNQLKQNGYAKGSVTRMLSVLSVAYEYAIEPLKYVQENPCQRIKIPKYETTSRQRCIIRPDEFERILQRFPENNIFHIPLLIGYYTGLRIGEVFSLTWEDIDLEQRTISVTKSAIKRNFGTEARKVLPEKGKKEEKSGIIR